MPPNKDQIKFENKLKKLKLRAEYDAKEIEVKGELDHTLESQFLDHVLAFEEAAAKKKTARIIELLDYPEVPKPASIPDDKIETCLQYIIQILNAKNIYLDSIYEVPPKELYRFIVEDLFPYKISVIEVPGLQSCFTYEEFIPNHTEDLKSQGREFVKATFNQKPQSEAHQLWNEISYHGKSNNVSEFIQWLEIKMLAFSGHLIENEAKIISMTDEKALVKCDLKILHDESISLQTTTFGFRFDYGYWYMESIEFDFIN